MTQNKWTVDIDGDDEDDDGWDGSIPWATDARRNNNAQCSGHDVEQNETDGDSDQSVFLCAAHTHTSVDQFDVFHGAAPTYLTNICSRYSDNRLRSSARDNFVVRRTRTRFADSSFAVAGPAAWNSLPVYIRNIGSHSALSPFNGHFPGEPELAGVYWSKGWWRWWWQLYWSYKSCKAPVISSPPTNQYSVFLQAGCPSCRPTNSVKALKANQRSVYNSKLTCLLFLAELQYQCWLFAQIFHIFMYFMFFNFNLCWCCESMCWRK